MIAVGYRGSGAGVKVYLDELQLFGGHAEGDELYSIEGVIGSAFSELDRRRQPQRPPWTRLATTTSMARAAMTGSRAVAATTVIHQVVLTAMGMPLFDNLDLEAVAAEAARRNRWEFLLMAAPLAVETGTGSPLNPLAVF